MPVEPAGWGDSETGSTVFDVGQFVVELEGQPTPEGVAYRMAETQNRKNQILGLMQNFVVDMEYHQALYKIDKARALQEAVGTVQQREAFAEEATKDSATKIAKAKGQLKMLNMTFDNLNSAQIALSGQIKTMKLQNDLIRE